MATDRAATAGRARESAQAMIGKGHPCSAHPACWHPLVNEGSRLERSLSWNASCGNLLRTYDADLRPECVIDAIP